MAEAIDRERRELASQLWIEEGLTYDAVATRTGISVGALKKWAADEGWSEKRAELRQTLRDIRMNKIRYLGALIKNANQTLHAQDAFAVAAVSGVVDKVITKGPTASSAIAPEQLREIKTPAQAIDALQEAVEQKVNGMLATGDISLAAIRDTRQCLELIDKMKAQYAPAEAAGEAKQRGLSEEAADEIRKKILGLS